MISRDIEQIARVLPWCLRHLDAFKRSLTLEKAGAINPVALLSPLFDIQKDESYLRR